MVYKRKKDAISKGEQTREKICTKRGIATRIYDDQNHGGGETGNRAGGGGYGNNQDGMDKRGDRSLSPALPAAQPTTKYLRKR